MLFTLAWILIYFHWNISVGAGTVGLLPDFLGYLLLWVLLRHWKMEGGRAKAARILCLAMTGVSGALYVVDILGLIGELETLAAGALGLLAAAPALALAWLLTGIWAQQISEQEKKPLRMLLWLLIAGEAGTYLFLGVPPLPLLFLFLAFAAKILLLVLLQRTGKGTVLPKRAQGAKK